MGGKMWWRSRVRSDNRKSKTCTELSRRIENRKWLGLLLIAFLLVACGAVAQAQQAAKIFRIGFLDSSTVSGSAVLVDAFRQELRKLGWIEGKNINIEYRFSEQKNERLPELAADLVRLKGRSDRGLRDGTCVGGQERHYDDPHRDNERWCPRNYRFGCQSGTAGRQCDRALEFIAPS